MLLTGIESQFMSMNSSLPDNWLYNSDVILQLLRIAGTVETCEKVKQQLLQSETCMGILWLQKELRFAVNIYFLVSINNTTKETWGNCPIQATCEST